MPDLLIVGAGLAGTFLALEAERLGMDVLSVDDPSRGSATAVATGLITPVTGMRLAVEAGAATTIPGAIDAFARLGERLGAPLVRNTELFRGYASDEEHALKIKRAASPETARWFGDDVAAEAVHPALNAPLGGFMMSGAAKIDLPEFLRATGAARGEKIRRETFSHADLVIAPDGSGVRWRDRNFRHVVFAEGAAVIGNPWFGMREWQPAKGEFITCDCAGADLPGYALKLGLSAVPLGEGRWHVGSNYDWESRDNTPTPAVREKLETGFRAMFRIVPDFRVVGHGAGVRPAARGAKPILGAHPEFPALHVFNGFGAKGCTWIPSAARDYAARLA